MIATPALDPGMDVTPAPPAAPPPSGQAEASLTLRQKGLLAMLAVLGLIALLGALVLAYKASTEADFNAVLELQAQVLAQAPQTDAVREAQAQAQARALHMRERGRALAVTLAVSAGLGVVLIGMVVVLFFTQLSGDIVALRNHALAVVGGRRDPPPTLPRHDELGDLGQALATLVRSLAAREAELEIERRNAFHQEKMAALGALAAGVLNDIGNPIAAIDGIAHAMKDAQTDALAHLAPSAIRPDASAFGLIDPEMILRETARLQVITRQIAQLASTQPTRAQLLSLNDVVRTALLMLHFDPRLSGVRVDTSLDPQLPALHGQPDRLLQLVMSLTALAAQAALSPRDGPAEKPLISVKTARIGEHLFLAVSDNGPAMNPDLLKQAFNPQPADAAASRGAGFALALCQSIVQQHGGQIRIVPSATAVGLPPGSLDGMQVEVTLPLQAPERPAHAAA